MDIKTYLSQERGRQASLAKAIGAHAPDVSKWASGERPIPTDYGAAIETATGGLVTREEMFPDKWQKVWPELLNDPSRHQQRPHRNLPDGKNVMSFSADQPADPTSKP